MLPEGLPWRKKVCASLVPQILLPCRTSFSFSPECFSLSLSFLFLLTIVFCYLFLDPPGGLSKQQKSFTLSQQDCHQCYTRESKYRRQNLVCPWDWLAACGSVVVNASYREACDPALGTHAQLLEDKIAYSEILDLLETALWTFHYRHDLERGRIG